MEIYQEVDHNNEILKKREAENETLWKENTRLIDEIPNVVPFEPSKASPFNSLLFFTLLL